MGTRGARGLRVEGLGAGASPEADVVAAAAVRRTRGRLGSGAGSALAGAGGSGVGGVAGDVRFEVARVLADRFFGEAGAGSTLAGAADWVSVAAVFFVRAARLGLGDGEAAVSAGGGVSGVSAAAARVARTLRARVRGRAAVFAVLRVWPEVRDEEVEVFRAFMARMGERRLRRRICRTCARWPA
ncbi:MAG: hypothetical protein N3I86_06400 [Verrucomicrobiae bacterium]|nr:hypothetical protein [Verrucomicrobiae bacterium]